ncbi:MAG: m protein [Cyanobacteriota bacterium]|jgi:phosphoesterase RecJ-like protein
MNLNSSQIIEQSQPQSKIIIKKILSAESAVVTAHLNPDGDTLASMLALARVLEQAGIKTVHRVMHDDVPAIYKFFPDQELVLSSQKNQDQLLDYYDLSFSCDCGSVARLGSAGEIWKKAKFTCNIDHHLSNPLYGDLNWVDPNATCTGQVVKKLADGLLELGKKIVTDQQLASLYYITLLTDTGGFRHSNTNPDVFLWASELTSQGADPSLLYNNLFNQMPFRAIKIIGLALAKLTLIELDMQNSKSGKSFKIAYTTTTRDELIETNALDEDTDEIVDHIMRIKDISACIYLREAKFPGVYKGSLRSAVPDFDCSQVASKLNGGGHSRAAGFNLTADSLDELKQKTLDEINNFFSR